MNQHMIKIKTAQGIVGVSVFYNIIFTILRIAFEQLVTVRNIKYP